MRSEQIWAQAGKRVRSGHLGPCTHAHTMHIPHAQHMQTHTNTRAHGSLSSPRHGYSSSGWDTSGMEPTVLTDPSQPCSEWSVTLLSFRKVNAVYLIYPCEASARQQADEMWKSNEK